MKKIALCMALALLLFTFTACGAAVSEFTDSTLQLEIESIFPEETTVPSEYYDTESMAAAITPDEALTNESNEEEETMQISVKSSEYEIIYELNDSKAAKELYAQLPLTMGAEPFSNNEMTFYPPKKLSVNNTPLSGGAIGSLSYYVPWGDVVMFYAPCSPNGSLYELGIAVFGTDNINKLSGTITISAN